jgi:hypothetical protein
LTAAVTGNPAASAAALNSVAPPPGASTVPTAMSSTRAGSMPERERSEVKEETRRSAAAVSLSSPLPPRQMGVRRAQVMTIWRGVSLRSCGGGLAESVWRDVGCGWKKQSVCLHNPLRRPLWMGD